MNRALRSILLVPLSGCVSESVDVSRPPTAFAGFDGPGEIGAPVVLDARQSLDPDGDPLDFAWALVARPNDSATRLSAEAEPVTELVPDRRGTYLVALTVSDGALSDRDLVAIEVGPAAPQGSLQIEVSPATCNLTFESGALTGPCADGAVTVSARVWSGAGEVSWTIVRAPAGVDVRAISQEALDERFTFAPAALGEYWVAARPRGGGAAVYATVLVHPPGPTRPAAAIEGPRRAAVRERVVLDARGSTANADARYAWRLFTDPSGGTASLVDRATGCLPDRCRRFTPDVSGVYVIALEITGADTATGATALHTIEVFE